jgi:hypothetical protein
MQFLILCCSLEYSDLGKLMFLIPFGACSFYSFYYLKHTDRQKNGEVKEDKIKKSTGKSQGLQKL